MAKKKEYVLKDKKFDPSYHLKESNLPAKKYKKGTPAQIRLSFEVPAGRVTRFIDIAAALSAVNRKAYRQGVYYYVNSVEMYDNSIQTTNLHVIPDTWMTRAAYRRAKGLYTELSDRALLNTGAAIAGKYHDFRVYMSNLHRTTGSLGPSLHNVNDAAQPLLMQEWAYSQFVTADVNDGASPADEFFAHMIGPEVGTGSGATSNVESVGVIESYATTRGTVQDISPNTANVDLTDPLLNLFDGSPEEVQNDVITNLKGSYDEPPYDIDLYTGQHAGHMQHVARLSTTGSVGRVVQEEGFCAPLGLICIDPVPVGPGEEDTDFRIVINLAPGTYNGVYAERMA